MKSTLLKQLSTVEKLAKASRWKRLFNDPYKYIFTIFFRLYIYPKNRRTVLKTATLFFGEEMQIALPASADIYLTGGKSHDSEIRLAKFIIQNLNKNNHFLDIGAHFGYFTLLASEIVRDNGKVYSFEPSTKNFIVLEKNSTSKKNITTFKKALSDHKGSLSFFEFPNMYSEYNSLKIEQFKSEDWYSAYKPEKIEVETVTIDEITMNNQFNPLIIKIDVEGAEYDVMKGSIGFISKNSPLIVMEYLETSRHNEEHQKAVNLLKENNYTAYIISQNGELNPIEDIDSYLVKNKLESDNIVFKK